MGLRPQDMFLGISNGIDSVCNTVSPLISDLSYGVGKLYHSLIEIAAENELISSIVEIVIENKLSMALSLTCLILLGTVGVYHLRLKQLSEQVNNKTPLINLALEKKDEHGRTPLILAVEEENLEKVMALLVKGADCNARDSFQGSPLLLAAALGAEEIVKLLCQAPNMEAVDEFGHTSLHLAARGGHTKVVEVLIQKGAKLAAETHTKQIAAELAQQNGYGETAEVLIKAAQNQAKPIVAELAQQGGQEKHVPILSETAKKIENNRHNLLERSQFVMTLKDAMATDNVDGVESYLKENSTQENIEGIRKTLLATAKKNDLKKIAFYLEVNA